MRSRRRTPLHSRAVATLVFATWACTAVSLMGREPREADRSAKKAREWTRVRPLEGRAARAIQAGYALSATFRRFVDEIEESDLVVYVNADPYRAHSTEAFLQFMSKSAGLRYVTAWVDPRHDDDELVALVGHELEHAVELARACEVGTPEEFLAFYRSHGHVSGSRQYETATAQDATARIERELAGARYPFGPDRRR